MYYSTHNDFHPKIVGTLGSNHTIYGSKTLVAIETSRFDPSSVSNLLINRWISWVGSKVAQIYDRVTLACDCAFLDF